MAGLSLLSMLVGSTRASAARIEAVLESPRRLSVWASALWLGCALLSIVLLSVELEPERAVSTAPVWSYVTNIPAGKGLLTSAGLAVLSIWLCRVAVTHGEGVPAELRIGVVLFGLLPLPLTGHAADWRYHEVAAAAWW